MAHKNFWEENLERKSLPGGDGGEINYQVLGDRSSGKTIALAHGLGGRLYTWRSVLKALVPDYRIVAWHYRGLFESKEAGGEAQGLAVPGHADDLLAVMDREKIEKLSLIGWSMGVQVALEFAFRYPERLEKLVLVNGTFGEAFSAGFQPLGRIPGADKLLHGLVGALASNGMLAGAFRKAGSSRLLGGLSAVYGMAHGNPDFKNVLRQYVDDLFGRDFRNCLRLFQELDFHSAYPFLGDIRTPALVVYGNLDYLTPAYLSRLMVRRMPGAEALKLSLGTHFTPLEYPNKLPRKIRAFLERQEPAGL